MISMEELKNDAAAMTVWQRHRFFLLIAGVIVVAFILVLVSLHLYNSSGAAQVDLSLPALQAIQKDAKKGVIEDSFPASGKLDAKAFDTFDKLYNAHSKQVVGIESFDPGPLDMENLQLMNESGVTAQ